MAAATKEISTAFVIAETCPYCQRGRSLADLMPFAGTRICQSCYFGHLAALSKLSSGEFPTECTECHVKVSELMLRKGAGDISMKIHWENGVYRFLCTTCDRWYVRKRAELYGPTEFGYRIGLK